MATSKHIDKICLAAALIALLLTAVFANGENLGIQPASTALGYESRLFDASAVHSIDIVMDDWDSFIETCENEEYALCSVVIDNEAYKNVAIRAKGNTSLSSVAQLGSERYSFKIEFDHYDSANSYYGLDKLCLNNLIQDNTMLKDYLTYQMMGAFGVDAPLCSFVYITVNGEDWGLYLAVEGVEDAFLTRNYGSGAGELYKPDSTSMGGGPGNGRDFSMGDFLEQFSGGDSSGSASTAAPSGPQDMQPPDGFPSSIGEDGGTGMGAPADGAPDTPEGIFGDPGDGPEGGFADLPGGMGGLGGDMGGMGSSDVKLQYIDGDPDSYSSIFENAKTDVTEEDQQRLIAALKSLSEGDAASSVNIDEVLRYFVVHNYVVNGDSYTGSMVHNYYLYEQDGLLSMIPWDYNLAFGGFQSSSAISTVNDPIDTPLSVTGDGTRPMADWIFQDETYTALYHQYFEEFLETVDINGILDSAYALIAPYVEKDPTKFCTYEEFELAVTTLKAFCRLRSESVSGQLDGSIPSTSSGQNADSSSLVDASGITISDMGSMNSTMGIGKGGDMGGGAEKDGMGVKGMKDSIGGRGFSDHGSTDAQQPGQPADSTLEEGGGMNAQQSGQAADEALPNNASLHEAVSEVENESSGHGEAAEPEINGKETEPAPDTGDAAETLPDLGGGRQTQEDTNDPGQSGQLPQDRIPDDFAQQAQGSTQNDSTLLLLGVSMLFLLFGLVAAFKCRH